MDVQRGKTALSKNELKKTVNLFNAAYKPNLPESMEDKIPGRGEIKGSDLTVPGQWRWVGAEAGGHLGSGRQRTEVGVLATMV